MKKVFIFILLIALIGLSGCGRKKTFTVTFETNGGNAIQSIIASKYTVIKNLEFPTKDNNIFKGWFLDSDFKKEFLYSLTLKEDITLYAKWEPFLYSIYFNGMGGMIDGRYDYTITKPLGAMFELPTPIKEGYTFAGWYEVNSNELFDSTTMPAEDMSLFKNSHHYPKVFWPSDYSYETDNGKGGTVLYTEEELIEQRLRNLDTFQERFRGNTVFHYMQVQDVVTGQFLLTPTYTGVTYSKASADYIKKNNLARTVEDFSKWYLYDISKTLINGYGVHINCDNSPITNNPFMSEEDFEDLQKYYPLNNYVKKVVQIRELYNNINSDQLYTVYKILYTSYTQKDRNTGTIPVFDLNGNPILRGGYHAVDKDGHFLYDENGKPIQSLFKYEPRNNDELIYSKDLYAKWNKDN